MKKNIKEMARVNRDNTVNLWQMIQIFHDTMEEVSGGVIDAGNSGGNMDRNADSCKLYVRFPEEGPDGKPTYNHEAYFFRLKLTRDDYNGRGPDASFAGYVLEYDPLNYPDPFLFDDYEFDVHDLRMGSVNSATAAQKTKDEFRKDVEDLAGCIMNLLAKENDEKNGQQQLPFDEEKKNMKKRVKESKEDIYDLIIDSYEEFQRSIDDSYCEEAAEVLKNAGYTADEVRAYFDKDGYYDAEDSMFIINGKRRASCSLDENPWDLEFADSVVEHLKESKKPSRRVKEMARVARNTIWTSKRIARMIGSIAVNDFGDENFKFLRLETSEVNVKLSFVFKGKKINLTVRLPASEKDTGYYSMEDEDEQFDLFKGPLLDYDFENDIKDLFNDITNDIMSKDPEYRKEIGLEESKKRVKEMARVSRRDEPKKDDYLQSFTEIATDDFGFKCGESYAPFSGNKLSIPLYREDNYIDRILIKISETGYEIEDEKRLSDRFRGNNLDDFENDANDILNDIMYNLVKDDPEYKKAMGIEESKKRVKEMARIVRPHKEITLNRVKDEIEGASEHAVERVDRDSIKGSAGEQSVRVSFDYRDNYKIIVRVDKTTGTYKMWDTEQQFDKFEGDFGELYNDVADLLNDIDKYEKDGFASFEQ